MRIKINGYNLDQYCGGLASSGITHQINPTTGKAHIATRRMIIEGEVKGADQASVGVQIAALESAVNSMGTTSGGDVGLTLNDGTTPSQHWLLAGTSIGGIHVVAFEWLPCVGTQYTVRRNFVLVCEAEYKIAGSPNTLQFEDSISKRGTGGPVFMYQPVIVGAPRKVYTNEQSTYGVVQSGQALGYEYAPSPATPLFADEHVDRRINFVTSGASIGGRKQNYRRVWSYQFESTNNFVIPSSF